MKGTQRVHTAPNLLREVLRGDDRAPLGWRVRHQGTVQAEPPLGRDRAVRPS